MLIYDKSGKELRHRILLSFFVVEILTTQESVAKLNLEMVRLTENQDVAFWWSNFSSASFYVFEMWIFGKLMKRRFQRYIGLPFFLLQFLLCVQSFKSCREGSILTEPPPPPPLNTELINLISNKNSEQSENLINQGEQLINHSDKTASSQNQPGKQNPKKQQPQHHNKGKQLQSQQQQSSPTGSKNRDEKLRIGKVNVVKLRMLTQVKKDNRKNPTIIVVRDSMIKNIKDWLMSRKKQVKFSLFPGATTEEMNFFLKPLISRKPDQIILHTGTNDLSQGSVEQVSCNIIKLA